MSRRILVCCGGRDLTLNVLHNEEALARDMLRDALCEWEPTHVLHGNQRGGDRIWHDAIRMHGHPRDVSVPCQEIRVAPTIGLLDSSEGRAYADRTRLLWTLALALHTGGHGDRARDIACFALPGGRGTDLCKRLARQHGAEVREFAWSWRATRA